MRVIGYPGNLRFDHPTSLKVQSGIKTWMLPDLTLNNVDLVNDSRDAAAEFDLTELLDDLERSRPLRISLPGNITDLPIPPFVVDEWKSLLQSN